MFNDQKDTQPEALQSNIVGGAKKGQTKKRLFLLGLCIVAASVVIGWYIYSTQGTTSSGKSSDRVLTEYVLEAKQLERSPVPTDPREQITYYGTIYDAYRRLGDKQKTLDYSLKLQETVEKNKLDQRKYGYNFQIALAYKDIGDKDRAKQYLQTELKLSQELASDQSYIDAIEKELKAL